MPPNFTRALSVAFFAALLVACPDRRTEAPGHNCELFVERVMTCNEPARVETWLVPLSDPAIPRRNCQERMNEPPIRDEVQCVLASDGSCEELYACNHWVAGKYSSRFPDPDRPPPPHMRRGGD